MMSCIDCGIANPSDTHTCQQYEDRVKAERALMTVEERLAEYEARIEALEQRLAQVTVTLMHNKPWSVM